MPPHRPPAPPPLGWFGRTWRTAFVVLTGAFLWTLLLNAAPENASELVKIRLVLIDPFLGIVCMVLCWWRRRWPVPIALVVAVLTTFSSSGAGAATLTLASVATRRRWREVATVAGFSLVSGVASEYISPERDQPGSNWYINMAMIVLVIAATVAVGNAVGSRRELVISLRERAETAEREQQARVAQAAAAERTRIAREMHDVLAHRISLVAMHAGALTYRTDLTPEEQAEAARTIETNAHQALQDLRQVLGVLRDTRDDGSPEPPQPGLEDISALLEAERGLGVRIAFERSTTDTVPNALGRTAYRIIQEAVTNARKHAPSATVRVSISGGMEDGLSLEVHNARSVRAESGHTLPASGLGLLGLKERVALAGGDLTHGPQPDGGYSLRAWLPWPT